MDILQSVWDGAVSWLSNGLIEGERVAGAGLHLVATHITIAAVTIFLHRSQAHRALDLGPIPSHFFRFWLWLTTGMVTKEWVAIHRKHHAKCETVDDPHSPVTKGIETVLLRGSELYRAEAKNQETLAKVRPRHAGRLARAQPLFALLVAGRGPDADHRPAAVRRDRRHRVGGADAVDPDHRGRHHQRHRPLLGLPQFRGGGRLDQHLALGHRDRRRGAAQQPHTYPTSAKLSVKPYEFDIGWGYIRAMEMLGWAKVRKTPPMLKLGEVKPVADGKTLEAIIANRYEVMAKYATELRAACGAELDRLKAQGGENTARVKQMLIAKRWLHRDQDKIPAELRDSVAGPRRVRPR